MYSLDASFMDTRPTIGNRNTGMNDVTAIGSASVIQKTAIKMTQYAHFAS